MGVYEPTKEDITKHIFELKVNEYFNTTQKPFIPYSDGTYTAEINPTTGIIKISKLEKKLK